MPHAWLPEEESSKSDREGQEGCYEHGGIQIGGGASNKILIKAREFIGLFSISCHPIHLMRTMTAARRKPPLPNALEQGVLSVGWGGAVAVAVAGMERRTTADTEVDSYGMRMPPAGTGRGGTAAAA